MKRPTMKHACSLFNALLLVALAKDLPLHAETTPSTPTAASPMKAEQLCVWKKSDLPETFEEGVFIKGESVGVLSSLSFALWMRVDNLVESRTPILAAENRGNLPGFHLSLLKNGTLALSIHNGRDWIHTVADKEVPVGSWHHVAVVCDVQRGGSISFYIDGNPAGTQPLDLETPLEMNSYRLGAWPRSPGHFHGAMDDVRLYSGLLQCDEIPEIMGAPRME